MTDDASIPPRIREHLARLYPTLRAVACEPLAPDAGEGHATTKAAGYGEPMRIALAGDGGEEREVVWHVAGGDEFGHERRSDRVANLLLASEDFARVPEHAAALDVGVIGPDGAPRSLLGCGEPYLLTDYVRGTIYADDLRRVAREGTVTPLDLARVDALARYLVRLHLWGVYTRERGGDPSLAACAPPFFAWRALVVCNPHFYPALSGPGRRALLGLAEGALDAGHFDPAWADELFV